VGDVWRDEETGISPVVATVLLIGIVVLAAGTILVLIPTLSMSLASISKTFQNFEKNNGTPSDYYYDVYWASPGLVESPVHEGKFALKMEAQGGANGGPGDPSGGTVRIYPASPTWYVDMSEATSLSVWIYDTQGNNTVELRLRDIDGDGGDRTQPGTTLWSDEYTQQNQWTRITWDLTKYPDVPNLDWDKISSIEIYMWWDGTYYFDEVTYVAPYI